MATIILLQIVTNIIATIALTAAIIVALKKGNTMRGPTTLAMFAILAAITWPAIAMDPPPPLAPDRPPPAASSGPELCRGPNCETARGDDHRARAIDLVKRIRQRPRGRCRGCC